MTTKRKDKEKYGREPMDVLREAGYEQEADEIEDTVFQERADNRRIHSGGDGDE